MTDAALMRGVGWVRCCFCGALHEEPYEDLHMDDGAQMWDVCAGECAREIFGEAAMRPEGPL